MKITDLFNAEWSQETENLADVMVEAILAEEESPIISVQQAAVFRELLCDAITNEVDFELTEENQKKLIATSAVYAAFVNLVEDGKILITKNEEGEEVVLRKN